MYILLVMAVAGFSALTGALAGDQITLEVVRGNETMQVNVTLGEAQTG